ncbi:GNAT family N-acetyltransferase [Candidatus Babeliales bacterium]|nr:GNAT family N-acetyltransferase [Candidatus Babeliales bacterium]MBP9843858.1 GNAT family N-acetyltransferase [Candidatus Babeliales bacterium]
MMKKILLMICMLQISLVFADNKENQEPEKIFTVRQATLNDKDAMVEIRRKLENHFRDIYVVNHDDAIERHIARILSEDYSHGFGFVVECQNKVVGYSVKNKFTMAACRHVLSHRNCAIDPDFKDEKLGRLLLQHILQEVQYHHPNILRVEENISEDRTPVIEMLQQLGFIQEGCRHKAYRRSDGSFAAELLFVWFNPNFDENYKKE